MKADHAIVAFLDGHAYRCFTCRRIVYRTRAGERAAYWRHRPEFYPLERRPA